MLAGSAATVGLAGLARVNVVRAQSGEVNLYLSRHYDTDLALYGNFTKATGLRVNRIEADADPLIERIRNEGVNSPCDLFITVDAGRLERARGMGLLRPLSSPVLDKAIPAHLRDPDGFWYGFSKRARVIMYSRAAVNPADLSSYETLADPRWKGKVLTRSSTNIYSQSLTGSILAAHGEAKTEAWAKGLAANFARAPRGGDTDQIRAVAAGEGDVGLSNTYYLGNLIKSARAEDRAVAEKVAVFFPNQADRGVHVNISGGGIATHAKNPEGARRFLEYLASADAQRHFADGNSEFPVVAGVVPPAWIASMGSFKEDQLNARVYARNNAEALKIMDRAGWK